ncbi:MAG: Uncharacterized protein CEO21_288, partial [Microgenomates group bacterium Gr01-1014_80]
ATQSARLATLEAERANLADVESRVKSQESSLEIFKNQVSEWFQNSEATSTADTSGVGFDSPEVELGLTPPDILLATGSATLAELKVTESLSSEKLFTALDATVSGTLKVFGEAILPKTTVAGDLNIDGAFSISGNSINVIGVSQGDALSTQGVPLYNGILYLQNSPLAQAVDIFNGLVTIDNTGNLVAQTITASEYRVKAGQTSGSGTLAAREFEVPIFNTSVGTNSRILISRD